GGGDRRRYRISDARDLNVLGERTAIGVGVDLVVDREALRRIEFARRQHPHANIDDDELGIANGQRDELAIIPEAVEAQESCYLAGAVVLVFGEWRRADDGFNVAVTVLRRDRTARLVFFAAIAGAIVGLHKRRDE